MAVSMGLLDTIYVIIGSDKCRNEKHLVLRRNLSRGLSAKNYSYCT